MLADEKAPLVPSQRREGRKHPYLSGNFAPVTTTQQLTPCTYTGRVPIELAGGQYVRNGGNPLQNTDLARDAHWFDGDGMLSGVLFRRSKNLDGTEEIVPEFVNQFILTDVYLASLASKSLSRPILPSIATLVNPLSSLWTVIFVILRSVWLVLMTHLPGSIQKIKKISVANTAIIYHDGRALATCESGPPVRVLLPGLETVGWFNGKVAENEPPGEPGAGYGGEGLLSWMKEWTTGHPRVDPQTKELITFHSTFAPPYIHYAVVPATKDRPASDVPSLEPKRLHNVPVPGVSGAKMMHDFGVSKEHTVIMDLPLSLDPMNIIRGLPTVHYDPQGRSRFGVFPRHEPENTVWFETNPCCIFHTANTWDTTEHIPSHTSTKDIKAVSLLSCRLTSASLVYSAGDLAAPIPTSDIPPEVYEDEQCRLYYHQFLLPTSTSPATIFHEWALSAIPFEFPTMNEDHAMTSARYIYGCAVSGSGFGAALGRGVKVDYLAKIDALSLIEKGKRNPPTRVKGCVDTRSIPEIVAENLKHPDSAASSDIKLFELPANHFAQESRFVSRANPKSEDDGFLLTYVFDEAQLDSNGEAPMSASSELWVIDALNMSDVLCKITLGARVPYGLHGAWFPEGDIENQRAVEAVRRVRNIRGVDVEKKALRI